MEKINRLKEKVSNSTHIIFDGDCVRKRANMSKLNSVYKFDFPFFDPQKLMDDLPIVSPKLKKLLDTIDDLDKSDMRTHGRLFKHFIFSDIKGMQGAKVITSSLAAKGMKLGYNCDMKTSANGNVTYGKIELETTHNLLKTRFNNFYLLSSVGVYEQPLSVSKKKEILARFNSRPDNVYGDIARIIVMDSGFKEGIDLFDIKYVHIFETQTTMADQKQVIGRGTRTCGQKGLVFHPTRGWPLLVFNYDVEINEKYRKTFSNSTTAFDLYLKSMKIDLRLFNFLSELEETYIYGSVDYKLNENIHNFSVAKSGSKSDANSSTKYSSANTIESLNSADFDIPSYSSSSSKEGGAGSKKNSNSTATNDSDSEVSSLNESVAVTFPSAPLDFKGTRRFIQKYFSKYKWTNVIMENLCGYAGPPLGKGEKKLPQRPSFTPPADVNNEEIPMPSASASSTHSTPSLASSSTKETELSGLTPTSSVSSKQSSRTVSENIVDIPNLDELPSGLSNKTGSNQKDSVIEELKVYSESSPSSTKSLNVIKGGGVSTIVNLSPSQAFIQNYFTPETPQKGVLLNWSVGTGKTCAAIATASASFESAGYTILWVTRTTLKNDIWKNMFEQVCSDKIRKIIEDNGMDGKAVPQENDARMRLLSNSWSIRPMSYKQFSNLVLKKNSFYQSLVNKNGTVDPLRKTLLIIDEAHKLYGGNDLSSIERPDMNALHKALMNSYVVSGEDSVRIMLMTATPITVDPMELIKLVNLCRPPERQMAETFSGFEEEFSLNEEGRFTKEGRARFLDEIAGYISYLNREKDARQFSQPIIKQVTVPLVASSEIEALIQKYDLPYEEDVDSEEYKMVKNLENEMGKQTEQMDDWSPYSSKAKFKPLLNKCNELDKGLRKECVKTVNQHINEIIQKAKAETTAIKERIKGIKAELKGLNMFKKQKIKQVRDNIKNASEDYLTFKDTLYSKLKYVCGKKIKDFKNLKDATEELPEIVEINNAIKDTDMEIQQLEDDYKNKIELFKSQIEAMKENIRNQKGLPQNERKQLVLQLEREKKHRATELKEANQNKNYSIKILKIKRRGYETEKKKAMMKVKKDIDSEVKTKAKDLNKTRKLKKKMEDLNAESGVEELNKLITDKKAILQEEMEKFHVKNKEAEESKKEMEKKKREEKEREKERKEAEKKKKGEEKEREKQRKDAEKEREKQKKEVEKEHEKQKKEVEKRKKEEEKEREKRRKEQEKEEARRKKEQEKQTKKAEKKPKNNKTKKNGSP